MRKRRKALLWLLTGLLIVFGVILVSEPPRHRGNQPVYKGLTLAQWLDVVANHRINGSFPTFRKGRPHSKNATPEQIHEAEEAVHAIGTNALPSLLKWISYEPSHAKRFYRGVYELLPLPRYPFLYRNEELVNLAVQGFAILNTNALPAAEELARMANDTNHVMRQQRAAKVLNTVTNAPGGS